MSRYTLPAVMIVAAVLLAVGALSTPDTQPIGAPGAPPIAHPMAPGR